MFYHYLICSVALDIYEIYKKAFGALTILNPDISNHQDYHQNIYFVKYDDLQK